MRYEHIHFEDENPSLVRAALTMSTDGAARVAAHVSLAYFAVALAMTWLRPVWGGYVSSPRIDSALVVAFLASRARISRSHRLTRPPRRHSRIRSVLLGVGSTLALQALAAVLLLRAAIPQDPSAADAGPRPRPREGSACDGDEGEAPPGDDAGDDAGDARRHRGWLVLVWASVAPTPPEKPERGERAFATLADGELLLRRERGGDVVARVDLSGAEVRLCRAPGKWDAADAAETSAANRKKRHGFGAEKRWWKRLPIVLSHPTRALHRGHRVLWCYALSDAAKEAWTVALHKSLTDARLGADAHAGASALAATSRARSLTRDVDAFKAWAREASLSSTASADAADAGWASGGAAGAAINALASRIFFDMQRSPEKVAEVAEQLTGLCSGIPDLPRFVGPISVSNVHLGKSTPQVLAARLPPAAKPGTAAAPWDGGALAGRGACAAAELEVCFAGVAEMTLTTHLDLSVYADMIAAEEGDAADDAGGLREAGMREPVESAAPSASASEKGVGAGAGGAEERMRRLRSLAKKNASKLIGAVARKMAGVPISMTVKIKRLAGTTRVWIPPPPGDRLWFGFVGEPALDIEATPSFGQIGIKWHGLAERVSEAIAKQLLREIHAALVLPNGGNLILDPLTPFQDVPEVSVRELLAMGKTSQAFMRDRAAAGDADEAAEPSSRPTFSKASRETDGRDEAGGGSSPRDRAAFHTPNASLAVEVEDAVLGVSGGKEGEDDAEEAVAAMVDSFMSVGSRAADGDDEKNDVDDARAFATDEWTASPTPGVSRTRTGESLGGFESGAESVAPELCAVDPDAHPEAKPDAFARTSREPPRPDGGSSLIDVRFGAPFPRGGETTNSSASGRARSDSFSTPSARGVGGVCVDPEPNTNLASNLGRFAAGVAAKAARARASMRNDAAKVHEGVRRGGVKGGLDVAKSIAARAAKEMKH